MWTRPGASIPSPNIRRLVPANISNHVSSNPIGRHGQARPEASAAHLIAGIRPDRHRAGFVSGQPGSEPLTKDRSMPVAGRGGLAEAGMINEAAGVEQAEIGLEVATANMSRLLHPMRTREPGQYDASVRTTARSTRRHSAI